MNLWIHVSTRALAADTPQVLHRDRVLALAAAAVACAAIAPANAAALTPVTNAAQIFSDTILGISLAFMTGTWGYCGYKIGLSGATIRDVWNPFIGGAISAGAAVLAGAFALGG